MFLRGFMVLFITMNLSVFLNASVLHVSFYISVFVYMCMFFYERKILKAFVDS